MIQILGDLIADISMRLQDFPVQAKDIHRLSYLEVGPGGACNVAIMASRFGLQVNCLGEIGDDSFGLVVREGLKREGIHLEGLKISPGAKTPVAGVIVDRASEPAYLGHPGNLQISEFQEDWVPLIQKAEALFTDGWAEHVKVPDILLRAFAIAQQASVPIFFDPGPGNPDVDGAWVQEAMERSTVIMLNRSEATRFTGEQEDESMILNILERGPEMVVLKRGAQGLLLGREDERFESESFDVQALDTTGAGDSLAGAILFGVLRGMAISKLAVLANATGAAKIQKLGTGHNMPTMEEIRAVLEGGGFNSEEFLI